MNTIKSNNTLSQFSVYCGTYHKYNSGSLKGKWIDLSDFDSLEDFYKYCAEIHSDEEDPEFMFQDWESPIDGLISESYIDENVWDIIDFDEDKLNAISIIIDDMGYSIESAIYNFDDFFVGVYDSISDFVDEYLEMMDIDLNNLPEVVKAGFDWEKAWHSDLRHSFYDKRIDNKIYIVNRDVQ